MWVCCLNFSIPTFSDLQGACYSKSVCNGLELHWKQSHLSTQHNPLASALVGAIVCGDAVATVSEESETLDQLLNKLKRRAHGHEWSGAAVVEDYTAPFESLPWADLPGELLAKVIRAGGLSPTMACSMSQVCSSWRQSIASDKDMFRTLNFKSLALSSAGPAASVPALPWVVLQAISAANMAASVLAARFYHNRGMESNAKKHWMRAARMGHPEAAWRIGSGYYHGSMTLQQDSEEALLWLTRAARTLMTPGQLLTLRNTTGSSHLMSATLCRTALKECAHILGVVHLDGDATKQDTGAAIKWFQISHQHGCMEAGRMLQSLFRSGQY